MHKLTDIKEINKIMKMFGKHFTKSLGQNFLTDSDTIDEIVSGSKVDKDTMVLEIGPGIGVLTNALALACKKVVTVEIDSKLMPVLDYTLGEHDNITVINSDILKIDIPAFCKEHFGGEKVKVIANLPYYITTPIIMELLEYKECFSAITVMVQKEVAMRMVAKAGTKDYASLSIFVQYYTSPNIITVVPPDFFTPAPKVSSAVITLDILDKPSVTPKNPELFFKLVRASFAQRRKTITNSISNAGIGFTKQEIENAIETMELKSDIRGERLSLADFCKLSDILG